MLFDVSSFSRSCSFSCHVIRQDSGQDAAAARLRALFFYPRDNMLAPTTLQLQACVCLSVCLSVTSQSSIETAQRIELTFGMDAPFLRPVLQLCNNFITLYNDIRLS